MSDAEVAAIVRELTEFKDEVREAHKEIKEELVALKAWQTVRDSAAHDAQVRRDAYGKAFRWALFIWKNDLAKFVVAGTLAYVGLSTT